MTLLLANKMEPANSIILRLLEIVVSFTINLFNFFSFASVLRLIPELSYAKHLMLNNPYSGSRKNC